MSGLAEGEFDLLPHECGLLTVACWLRLRLVILWVEAVGPAPAGDEVGFVGFEGGGEVLDVFFGGGAVADESEVRGDPGEIERRERAEKVAAVDGAETVGEDEVVDDARPESVGHAEGVGRHERRAS